MTIEQLRNSAKKTAETSEELGNTGGIVAAFHYPFAATLKTDKSAITATQYKKLTRQASICRHSIQSFHRHMSNAQKSMIATFTDAVMSYCRSGRPSLDELVDGAHATRKTIDDGRSLADEASQQLKDMTTVIDGMSAELPDDVFDDLADAFGAVREKFNGWNGDAEEKRRSIVAFCDDVIEFAES